ncbi:MAG TPA: hypothetical protein VNS19_18985 [Acidimicrobiales bacterium]|nr:hypothetical protein [Acidimicrobiales bacterium]
MNLGGLLFLVLATGFVGTFVAMYVRAHRFRAASESGGGVAVRGRGSTHGTLADLSPVVCVVLGDEVVWRRFGPMGTETRRMDRVDSVFARSIVGGVTPCLVETSTGVSFLASRREIDLLEGALRRRGFAFAEPAT